MADGATIQELFVSLGFKVDESGRRRVESSLQAAGAGATDAQKRVAGLEQKIKDLQEQFRRTSDDPARKFAEFGTKIKTVTDNLRRNFTEFATSAVAATGAFVGAMQLVANNYTQLGRTAREMGTSVADLKNIRTAADQAGIGAEQASNALLGITQRIRQNPGIGALVDSWIGADWEGLKNKGRDGLLPILQYLNRIYEQESPQAAYAFGQMIGLNQRMIDQYRASPGAFESALAAADKLYRRIGVDQEQVAQKAERWNNQLKTIGESFGGIYTQAFDKAQPAFESTFNVIQGGLDDILDFNRENPGLGLAGAIALTTSGLQAAVPILNQFGVRVNTLNPYVLGFAAASAAVLANWDKIGPLLEQSAERVKTAFQEGGWQAAASEIGNIIKEEFDKIDWEAVGKRISDGIIAAAKAISNFGTWLRENVDWEAVGTWIGEKLGDLIVGAVSRKFGGAGPEWSEALFKALENLEGAAGQIGVRLAMALIRGLISKIPVLGPMLASAMEGIGGAVGERGAAIVEEVEQAREAGRTGYIPGSIFQKTFGRFFRRSRRGAAAETEAAPEEEAAPTAQRGGIVKIDAHEGEMILPANISRRLEQLVTSGGPTGGGGTEINSAIRKLSDWVSGRGAGRVIIQNVAEFVSEFKKAAEAEMARKRGEAGAPAQRAAAPSGAGAAAGAPGGAPEVAPGGAGGAGPLDMVSGLPEGAPALQGAPRREIGPVRPGAGPVGYQGVTQPTPGGRAGARLGRAAGAIGAGAGGKPSWEEVSGLIEKYESGGQNIKTRATGHTASGFWQINDPTWKDWAPKVGVDTNLYKTAMSAPREVQEKVARYGYERYGLGRWAVQPKVEAELRQARPASETGGRVEQAQSGIRRKPISDTLASQLETAAAAAGVKVRVTSGGQAKIGTGGPRTGSTRHDEGGAADVQLIDEQTGRVLRMDRPEDRARMAEFTKASVAAGATGVGAGPGYMGVSTMHIGGGASGTWGAGGRAQNAPQWLREAHAEGTAARKAMEQQIMTAQRGGIVPNILGGMAPIIAHAGEMILPQLLSQGLQRLVSGNALAGLERIGAARIGGDNINTYANRNATINQTNNTSINGADAAAIARFRDQNERTAAELVRNFRAAMA